MVKNLPAMWENWVRSLGSEDPLEEEMATHSSILAWRIPWAEIAQSLTSISCKCFSCDMNFPLCKMVWDVQTQFNCSRLISIDLTVIKPLDGSLKGPWEGQVFTASILDKALIPLAERQSRSFDGSSLDSLRRKTEYFL